MGLRLLGEEAVDVAGIDALPMTLGETGRVEGAPLLMSVKDAAIHLGIGSLTMYELINARELPSLTLGRRRLVRREALNQFVEHMSRPAR
jgi:excisionase family DNA binding protein